jgi:hypothetical protein
VKLDPLTKGLITNGESFAPFQRPGALGAGLMTFGFGVFFEYDAFDAFRNGGGRSFLQALGAVLPLLVGALVLRNALRFKRKPPHPLT